MDGLLAIGGILALVICAAGWRFVHQVKRRRLVSGALWSLQGLLWLGCFFIVLLVYANLHSYQRLTYEQPVADIFIRQLEPGVYQLSLVLAGDHAEPVYYELTGDQWQLDARILKWKGWANLIGLDSFYKLERLSSRYQDIEKARSRAPSVFDLTGPRRGLDIWELKRRLRDQLVFVDTLFGQGVYMPMADGAHYRVSVGQAGLITRPANEIARQVAF
jgi:hypothetical protein